MNKNKYKAGEIRIEAEDDLFTASIDKQDEKSANGYHKRFLKFFTYTKAEAVTMQEKLVIFLNNME